MGSFRIFKNLKDLLDVDWDNVSDGQYLKRNGTLIDGGSPGGGGLTDWSVDGSGNLIPDASGQDFGAVGNEVGNVIADGALFGGAAALRSFNVYGSGMDGRLSLQGPAAGNPGVEMTTSDNASRALIRFQEIGTDGTSLQFWIEPDGGSIEQVASLGDDAALYMFPSGTTSGSPTRDAGFRNSSGTMQYKDSAGSWTSLASLAGGGLDYWSEDGSGNLIPDTAGYNLGDNTNTIGEVRLSLGGKIGYFGSGDFVFNSDSVDLYRSSTAWFRFHTNDPYEGAISLSDNGWLRWTDGLAMDGGTNLALWRDDDNILAQKNGTNPQAFRVYNSYAGGFIDEFLEIGFIDEADTAVISTKELGSGTLRDIKIDSGTGDVHIGNFVFDSDQTVSASEDNYVLTYDDGTGKISLEVAAGGGGLDYWSEDGSGNLTPDADDTYSLGSSSARASAIHAEEAAIGTQTNAGGGGKFAAQAYGMMWEMYNGNRIACFSNYNGFIVNSNAHIGFSSYSETTMRGDTPRDTRLYRDDAGIFAQRNGSNAQEFRIYNTWTNSTDEFERANLAWVSNQFVISTEEGATTGTARDLVLQSATGDIELGNYIFDTDQTVSASEDNYVLTYDDASGKISLEAAAGGSGLDYWSEDGSGNLVPDADGTRDIGTTSLRPNKIYTDNIEVTANGKVGLTGTTHARFQENDFQIVDGVSTHLKMHTGGGDQSKLQLRDVTNAGYTFGIDSHTAGIYYDDAGILAQRNGSNAQEFRIYNDATDTSTDFERAKLAWESNEFVIGTESDGVNGAARAMIVEGAGGLTLRSGSGFVLFEANGESLGYLESGGNNSDIQLGAGANTIGGFGVIAIGRNASAISTRAVSLGFDAHATKYGTAIGPGSLGNREGQIGFPRAYDNNTDYNHGILVMGATCSDTSATSFVDIAGGANPCNIPSGRTFAFSGIAIAQKTTDQSGNATWKLEGLIKNVGGTTTLVNSSVTEIGSDNASAWSLSLTADDTNDALKPEVTAEADVTARISLRFVEQATSNFSS